MTTPRTRLGRHALDVRKVQRAGGAILELNEALDRRLLTERRPAERLRMLRETTNQITRAANDAIQAYRRARSAVDQELRIGGGDRREAQHMRLQLDTARADVLRALGRTSHRYAWADPWPDPDERPKDVGSGGGMADGE